MSHNQNIYSLLALFFLALMFGCFSKQKKIDANNHVDSSLSKKEVKSSDELEKDITSEDWIYDTILALDEVRKESEYVEKTSNGERQLSVAIYKYPDTTNNYYWVKAWEDNGEAYATHFNFYVYPKPRKILFLDTLNDTLLDLPTWRKSYKYFNFHQH